MEAQLLGSDLLKEGWLTKEAVGKSGGWKQRYFILKNNGLYYYEDKPRNSSTDKPKGIIELSHKSIVRLATIQKNYAFEVFTKPILLRVHATNQMERNQWMSVIKENIENLKDAELRRGGEREHKMEGFLVKRAVNSGRNWKKRWFVLKGGRMSYYEERPAPGVNVRPKGVMELTADTTVLIFKDNQSVKPNTFEVTAKKYVLTVSADTLETLKEWVNALDQQILAKAGMTSEGAIEVCRWLRTLGLQEYAKRMVDMGCDELASIWDRKDMTDIGDVLEMSRMEKDTLHEAHLQLKKSKKPKSFKESAKKKEEKKIEMVLFDFNPPPPGATTRLYTWGDSTNAQLGLVQARTGANVHTPTYVDALKNKNEPAFVSCGTAAMAAVTLESRNVFTWGTGPLGLGEDKIESTRPFMVTALRDVPIKQLACGSAHMVAVSQDGEVFTWGAGDSGQLGLGERVQGSGSPVLVPGVGPKDKSPISSCAAGPEHTILVSSNGMGYCFGEGAGGRLGINTNSKIFVPRKIEALQGHPIGQAACGDEFTLCISKTGNAAFWCGKICGHTLMLPERISRFTQRPISQCAAAGKSGMFLVGLSFDTKTGEYGTDSSVYTFGLDTHLIGQGDDEPRVSPTLVEDLEDQGVTQIAMSVTHAGCVTSEGNLLMWGKDDCGQLGSSYMVSIKRPAEAVRISGYKYTALALGDGFSSAICVEDKQCLIPDVPPGITGPPPPPPDEAIQAVEAQGEDLQQLLDQFAILSHKFDLMNDDTVPPPPPDDDIPPPPPIPVEKKPPQQVGGKRILPPGSEDLGNGWLAHTDAKTGKKYYEQPSTGIVQWTKPN